MIRKSTITIRMLKQLKLTVHSQLLQHYFSFSIIKILTLQVNIRSIGKVSELRACYARSVDKISVANRPNIFGNSPWFLLSLTLAPLKFVFFFAKAVNRVLSKYH